MCQLTQWVARRPQQGTRAAIALPFGAAKRCPISSQGNKDGKSAQLSRLLEVAFPQAQGSLQLRSGYSRIENPDDTREAKPYFGVGIYRAF
jgi:hypothetical protein